MPFVEAFGFEPINGKGHWFVCFRVGTLPRIRVSECGGTPKASFGLTRSLRRILPQGS